MATKKKWSAKVDTDSTHPDEGLFSQSASAIAKALASRKVSPKGPASGMRMLNFYINRAGKNLPKSRHVELERAKTLLSDIIAEQKAGTKPATKKTAKKTAKKTTKKATKTPTKKAPSKAAKKTPAKSSSKKSTPKK